MKKLAVANGTYPKDGQEKTRWVNVGVILEKDGKEFMLLDPTINFAAFPKQDGKNMVMVGIFEENNQQQPQQNQGYNQQQGQNIPVTYENQQQGQPPYSQPPGYNPNQR